MSDLKPHAKFQNPTITPSGRKVTESEEEERRRKTVYSGHWVPWQRMQAAWNNWVHILGKGKMNMMRDTVYSCVWSKMFFCCISRFTDSFKYSWLCLAVTTFKHVNNIHRFFVFNQILVDWLTMSNYIVSPQGLLVLNLVLNLFRQYVLIIIEKWSAAPFSLGEGYFLFLFFDC